ncbi:MAG: galactokinase [Treponema sp.]|jgi:galactokinase|nr:galactokinase [Treponema sp.]
MTGKDWAYLLADERTDAVFTPLYGRDAAANRERYVRLLDGLLALGTSAFPEIGGDIRAFSAAGRTELCGNHTDHNGGKVIAASIREDVAAFVVPRNDKRVLFRSTGFPDVNIDLSDIAINEKEKGTTESLVRGIASEFEKRGTSVGGWTAVADSSVPPGSGISSSAAVEVLFGKIFDSLYGGGSRNALEIARIGQTAENRYFGKPSGLMDQAACASGGVIAIDFSGAEEPIVRRIDFDPSLHGYALVVVNTRGSHVDLTPDYAAVAAEMRAVAAFFGKETLCETSPDAILANAKAIREMCGDRALMRAMHFHNENNRVDAMYRVMRRINMAGELYEKQTLFGEYLAIVNESGHSSWELLQNMYPPSQTRTQALCAALAVTRELLAASKAQGACRVHGGGFAGTIQAYIPNDMLRTYTETMDAIFGGEAASVLTIRPAGMTEVLP